MDLKGLSTDELNSLIKSATEELRLKSIKENANKVNKFNNLLKGQTAFIRALNPSNYKDLLDLFAKDHVNGRCLDDGPHKDLVIGGCPCARCTLINMRNGTIEHTLVTFGVMTRDKF